MIRGCERITPLLETRWLQRSPPFSRFYATIDVQYSDRHNRFVLTYGLVSFMHGGVWTVKLAMRPLHLSGRNPDLLHELDDVYRTTHDVSVRTRAQMILLAIEQRLTAFEIAAIVRESGETVRRWFHCYRAAGVKGLADAPYLSKSPKVKAAYHKRLREPVRQRPPTFRA